MVAEVRIRPCVQRELPLLTGLLDMEFVHSRGRRISLAERLPGVLEAANCPNILLACRGEAICACIAIKRFDWITPERSWRGAMIGLVYTRPEERGRGLASQLLGRAAQLLGADGTAFAVLFTAQPEFYRRLGWASADCGVFGTYASAGANGQRCKPAAIDTIEALRRGSRKDYLARNAGSYAALPLPAERLELRASDNDTAYAIYGVQGDRAYVYEFGGAPSGYGALWQDICAQARTVYINERKGSRTQRWLDAQGSIAWREQALAMWLPLAEDSCARHFAGWHIPYLDRI